MRHFFKIVCCVLGLSLSQVVAQSLAHPPVESRLDYRHSSGAIHYSNTGWFLSWNPLIAKQFSSQWLAWATPLSGHYLLSEKISHHHSSSEYSISPGIGARYLLMPQWALGFHFVHDRAFFKTTSDAHSPRSRGINIVGIENLWPFAKADVHLYYQYQQGWGWDSSCSIPLSQRLSVLVGGYYQSDHLGHLATKKIAPSTPRIGFTVGAQYHLSPAWDIKVQYSHNNYNEYDWSIKLQKRVGARSTNMHALLHQSIERNYVHPILLRHPESALKALSVDSATQTEPVGAHRPKYALDLSTVTQVLVEQIEERISSDPYLDPNSGERKDFIKKCMESYQQIPAVDIELFFNTLLNRHWFDEFRIGKTEREEKAFIEGCKRSCEFIQIFIEPHFTQQELNLQLPACGWRRELMIPNNQNYWLKLPNLEPHDIPGALLREPSSFEQLPNELLDKIFNYLPSSTQEDCMQFVSRRMYIYAKNKFQKRLMLCHRTQNATLPYLVSQSQRNPFVSKPEYILQEPKFNSLITAKHNLQTFLNKKVKTTNSSLGEVLSKMFQSTLRHTFLLFDCDYRAAEPTNLYSPYYSDSCLMVLMTCYFPEFYLALDRSSTNTLSQLTLLNYFCYAQSHPTIEAYPYKNAKNVYQPINVASLIFRNPALYAPILGMPDSRYPLYYLSMMALNSPPQVIMQELRYDPTVFNFIKEKYGTLSFEKQATLFPSESIRTSLNLLITFLAAIDQLEKEPTGLTLNQLMDNSRKTRTSFPRWNYPESLERVAVRELCSWMLSWRAPYSLAELNDFSCTL